MLARLVEADASGRPPLPRQMPPSMQEMLTLAENLHVSEQGPRPLVGTASHRSGCPAGSDDGMSPQGGL